GIYARSLQFAWDRFNSPGNHFQVQISSVQVTHTSGAWQIWADVSGQWTYLSGLAQGLLNNQNGQVISIPGATYDVYVQSTDTISIYVQGYQAECIDSLFGQLFGQTSYDAGLALIEKCGFTDNTDLGGTPFTLPPVPGSAGQYQITSPNFQVQVNVTYVSSP
ncbi:MAG TPA: hypothetical protein VKR61_20545, partial [Bryobacteraceae bacterium]|nr:hypothetical protein [Bryobacteraceae bacterium]